MKTKQKSVYMVSIIGIEHKKPINNEEICELISKRFKCKVTMVTYNNAVIKKK